MNHIVFAWCLTSITVKLKHPTGNSRACIDFARIRMGCWFRNFVHKKKPHIETIYSFVVLNVCRSRKYCCTTTNAISSSSSVHSPVILSQLVCQNNRVNAIFLSKLCDSCQLQVYVVLHNYNHHVCFCCWEYAALYRV